MHVIDYVIFFVVVTASLGIGLFYSFRQKTVEEYAYGGNNMQLLPIFVSIAVTLISASTIQGVSAEIYLYGVEIFLSLIGYTLGIFMVNVTFLPIFFELKPKTVFEYLYLRYNSKVPMLFGSVLSIAKSTIITGVIIFGPASALETMTGIPTAYNIVIMAAVCTIYTTIGGIRSVIWADFIQAIIMLLGLIAVLVIGLSHIGLTSIWLNLQKYDRTTIHINPDPTQRLNLWICIFGFAIRMNTILIDQAAMMRYTGLKTLKQARLSLYLSGACLDVMLALCILVGMVMCAYYAQVGCGPLESGEVYSSNQIVISFVVEILRYPGLPGLFVAALVSGCLSTVSSLQNATTVMLWKDIIKPICAKNISAVNESRMIKVLVAVFGVVMTGIAFSAMYVDVTLFQATTTIFGASESPTYAMFLLGACFTFTGSTAVVIGGVTGTIFCLWIALGQMFNGNTWVAPELITESCYNNTEYMNGNMTLLNGSYYSTGYNDTYLFPSVVESNDQSGYLIHLYSISPFLYHTVGTTVAFVIGLLLSLIPQFRNKRPVDEKLLVPSLRKFMRKEMLVKKNNNNIIIDKESMLLSEYSVTKSDTVNDIK